MSKWYFFSIGRILLGLGVLLAIFVVGLTGCRKEIEVKPNIIYILMDDLGYGELETFGQCKIETPNVDALRVTGMKFTQHYSGSSISIPSRCVLMTGQHSGHAQIRGNDEMESRGAVWCFDSVVADERLEGQVSLKEGTMTLGRMMQSVGYRTGCVGKWGLGYPGSPGVPNKQGFDFFFGYNCHRMAYTCYPPFLWRDDQRVVLGNDSFDQWGSTLDEGANPYDERSYDKFVLRRDANDLMRDEVLTFVKNNKDKPFFLMWTTPIPHASLQAPDDWVRYYVKKFGDEEPYLGGEGYLPCRYPRATYAAMVSYFDEQVGNLIETLKAEGLYDNTVVIFTSDNGPAYGGGTDSPWFNSGGIFKSEAGWGKGSLHEGGIRVPMIVSWPKKIEACGETDHISGFQDVMPTLAEIVGIECPPTDGISFLPTLLEKSQRKHDYLYFEFPELGGARAIRKGDMKLLVTNIKKGPRKVQLFDLSKDVQEQNDISAGNAGTVKELMMLMEKSLVEAENPKFRMPFVY